MAQQFMMTLLWATLVVSGCSSGADDDVSMLQTRLQEESNASLATSTLNEQTEEWVWPHPFNGYTCHPNMGQKGHKLVTPLFNSNPFTASTHEACAHACLEDARCELFQYEVSNKACSLRVKVFVDYDQSSAAKGQELCVSLSQGGKKYTWVYACWQDRHDSAATFKKVSVSSPAGPHCAEKCWKDPTCRTFDWTMTSCRLSTQTDQNVVSQGGIQHCRVYGSPTQRRYGETTFKRIEVCTKGVFFTSGPKIKTSTAANRQECLSHCAATEGCTCYIYDPTNKKCNQKRGCHPKLVGHNRASKKRGFLSCMVGGANQKSQAAGDCMETACTGTNCAVKVAKCQDGKPSQQWVFKLDPTKRNTLYNPPSGKCLDIWGGCYWKGNNCKAAIWSCNNNPNQAWVMKDGALFNAYKKTCLTGVSGRQLTLSTCKAEGSQKWLLTNDRVQLR